MNWPALVHVSLLLVMGSEVSAVLSESLLGSESGLVTFSKDGQRLGSFVVPFDADSSGLEPTASNHESMPNNGKSVKTHLLAQQEFPLFLADHSAGARLPYSYGKLSASKYLLKPIRELNVANSLFSRGDEMSTLRARRYSYPSSQSFLRFGRRNKRPRDAKDTAFLRFGRAQQQTVPTAQDRSDLDNSADTTGLP